MVEVKKAEKKAQKGRRVSGRRNKVSKSVRELEKRKEEQIQTLIGHFRESGYEVRREKLKRGPGWSVQGGTAAVYGQDVLFVDRNLNLDDQLEFLIGQYREARLDDNETLVESLPEALRRRFDPVQEVA